MNISVQGVRAEVSDWDAVSMLPARELPALTQEQRQVARTLGIKEEDYARSALTGQRTTEKLIGKTERFARYLQEQVAHAVPSASIEEVALNTWEHRFDVSLRVGQEIVPLRIAEDVIDDLFERGSREAELRLRRVLELTLPARVA
ncbi:MAG TPA: hypothetical protein VIX19_11825 [Terriglobales bacterium]